MKYIGNIECVAFNICEMYVYNDLKYIRASVAI